MSGRAENEAGKKRCETHPRLKSSDQVSISRPSRLVATPNKILLTRSASLRRALDVNESTIRDCETDRQRTAAQGGMVDRLRRGGRGRLSRWRAL